ncbi:ribosome hibernation-promoting factor, HPF/YfiA family [Pediococcus pentosaceus]|uniref:ribosome hibernation-promoting factor, HPF/YfiA family n=1 Tax=Pediococcus pentosaceus TaxID=1255 RepID=UPI003981ACEB
MLDYQVRGLNFEVTDAIQQYVEKRLSRFERYLNDDGSYVARVKVSALKGKRFKAEVTIQLPYLVLRAEDIEDDLYQAIDFVTAKLERQVRKYKTKVNRKSREQGYKGLPIFEVDEDVMTDSEEGESEIVRKKTVSLKPMDPQEAILQMELLQHDFFIFINAETDAPAVVYKRRDGKYALLDADD